MNIFRLAGDMTHLLSIVVRRRGAAARAACAARRAAPRLSAAAAPWRPSAGAAAEDSGHQVVCRCDTARAGAGRPACATAVRGGRPRAAAGVRGAAEARVCTASPGAVRLGKPEGRAEATAAGSGTARASRRAAGADRVPPAGRAGVSLRTQELYALVFACRYLDLFFTFISLCAAPRAALRAPAAAPDARAAPRARCCSYNTVMKLIFICATFAIIWYMRRHRVVSQTYSKEEDTFKIIYLVGPAFALALLVNHELSIMEARPRAPALRRNGRRARRAQAPGHAPRVAHARRGRQVLWTFSIYLEAVAILPQLVRAAAVPAAAQVELTRAPRPPAGDAAKLGQRGQPDGALRLFPRVRARSAPAPWPRKRGATRARLSGAFGRLRAVCACTPAAHAADAAARLCAARTARCTCSTGSTATSTSRATATGSVRAHACGSVRCTVT
jgi:hypothetical protein